MEYSKIKVLVFGVLVVATVVSAVWAVAFLRSDEFREIKEAQEIQELINGRHTPVPPSFLPSPDVVDRRSTPTPPGVSALPIASPGPTATPRITPTPSPKPTPFQSGELPFPSPTARPRSPDRRSA